jgi:regulator of protease activity HflC (stomatin/prohibitin superfamily)
MGPARRKSDRCTEQFPPARRTRAQASDFLAWHDDRYELIPKGADAVHFLTRIGLGLALAIGATGCAYTRVGQGEVAIVRTPSGVENTIYPTGDWRIGPWDSSTKYSIRSQEREEQLEVLASNGLRILLDASIRYHIVPEETVQLDREFGEQYYAILVGPTLRSQARRVVGRYQPEEIYSSQREAIERQVREGVEAAIKGRHIVLEAVLIRNVKLPEAIQGAINNKLEAEQQALKMKFVLAQAQAEEEKKLMQVKAEAERQKIAAQAEAEAKRTRAQADADAKKIDGEATAEYERLVAAHLSPQILKLREIEATQGLAHSPNSKLIFLGQGAHPGTLLDLRGGKSDNPY